MAKSVSGNASGPQHMDVIRSPVCDGNHHYTMYKTKPFIVFMFLCSRLCKLASIGTLMSVVVFKGLL